MSKVKFKYGTAEQLANAPYLEGTFYVISDDNSTDGILYADLHGNRICFGDVASLVKKVSKLESSAQDTKFEVDWLRSNIIKNTTEKDTTITADDAHTVPPQEVVIYGKSEQNGTPTPITPISIDSLDNKFTLHVAKNGITDYGDWPIMFDLGSYILRSLPDGTCDILRMSYSKPSEDAGWAMYDTTLEQTIASIALADLEWTQLSNGIFQGKNIPNSANGIIGTHQVLCDTYQEIETQSNSADMIGNDDKTIAFQSDYPYIFVKDTDYTNLDDFIASLGTSVISYPLATPIVHSLETIEFLGTVELPVLPNPMTAWVDDGNVQPDISMTYEVDNKIFSSNLIHAETDVSLDDIRDRINALENIDEILTNRLIATEADIDSLEVTKANIDSLEAAEARIDELEVSSATIQNLEATNARIGDLETDNLAVKRRLTAAEADIGNLEAVNVNVIGRLRATEADIEELTASKATVDDLIAVNANIQELEAANATITGKLTAAEASIEDLEAENATITGTLTAAQASIEDLEATNATITGRLEANEASIEDLEAANVTITGRLEANEADIDTLTASKADITDLNAATARIGSLETDNVDVKGRLSATEADIENLEATTATIESLNAAEARIGTLETDKANVADLTAATGRIGTLEANTADIATIRANSAKVANLTAQELEADHATIGSLDANYAQINMANVNNAWIQNGTVKDGAISNAMINSVSANKLTAGTIDASNITVTNLNADNITTGTINGQRIGAGSLSLDKLEENVYTEDEVNSIVDNLQNQIDGAIETWTGTEIPTLSNTPASDWTTNSIKDKHVGDIYFIVNSQSDQNGYNYRFTKIGNTYSWQLIKDSDVTQVLQRLTDAEGKIGDIEQFDTTISSWKNDTDEELRSIKSAATTLAGRVTTAEGTLQTKVDTTTFNTLSQTVDGHSSSISQLTTETTTLTQAVDTLNTKTSSDSGNIVQFDNSIGFKEIVVHGKSTQANYTGIQMLNDATSTREYKASNTGQPRQSVYDSISDFIPVVSDTSYYLQHVLGSQVGYSACWYDTSKNFLSYNNIYGSSNVSGAVTSPTDAAYLRVSYVTANSAKTMVTQGSTATSYEPYTGGKLTPSPDSPQEIKSIDNLTLNVCRKNLLDISKWELDNNSGISINEDGVSLRVAQQSYQELKNRYYLPVKANFTISFDYEVTDAGTGQGVFYLKSYNENDYSVASIRIDATTEGIIKHASGTISNNTAYLSFGQWGYSAIVRVFNIQLELGDTATDYEPYQGQSIDISLGDHQIRSLPDGTEDTLTFSYIGPSIREGWGLYNVELVQIADELDLGTRTWTAHATREHVFYASMAGTNGQGVASTTDMPNLLCTALRAGKYPDVMTGNLDNVINYASTTNFVYVYSSAYTTATDFKAAVSGAILQYELITPITHSLGVVELPLSEDLNLWASTSLSTTIDATWWHEPGRVEKNEIDISLTASNLGNAIDSTTLSAPYTEVEWVESNGMQYVYLDWKPPVATWGFEADFIIRNAFTSSVGAWNPNTNVNGYGNIFGTRNASGINDIQLGTYSTNGVIRWGQAGDVSTGLFKKDKTRQQISLRGTTLTKADGTTVTVTRSTEVDSKFYANMTVFCMHEGLRRAATSGIVQPGSVRIYSLKFYDDDDLKVDLVGALRNSDGMTGLYDKVSEHFYPAYGMTYGDVVGDLGTPDTILEAIAKSKIVANVDNRQISRMWRVKIPELNRLEDGQKISVTFSTAISGTTPEAAGLVGWDESTSTTYYNVYLQIILSDGTETNWIPCFYGQGTRLTTHYGSGTPILLTYRENVFYNSSVTNAGTAVMRAWYADPNYIDGNTTYTKYSNSVIAGLNGIKRYTLCMKDQNGKWTSIINQANTVAATKTCYTGGLQLDTILYYSVANEIAAGNNSSDGLWESYGIIDWRYSFNVENGATNGLTLRTPLYLVGTLSNSDGLFYLDTTKWWTQTPNDPTKIYVWVSAGYTNYYQGILSVQNTVYAYDEDAGLVEINVSRYTRTATKLNETIDTVDEHTRKIGVLETTVENKADGSDLTTISNRLNTVSDTVDGHTQSISSLNSTMATKADSSSVETVSNRVNSISDTVDGHTQSISSINSTVATKADSSTVTTLSNNVNSISETVDGHTQSISSLNTTIATKADGSALTTVSNKVNTISDTVDEHSQSISSINTTLDTKADGSALTTVSNKLNTVSDTVDGHTQSISSINETLETKVDSSTVSSLTTKVNNISDTVDGHTQTIGSVQNTQTQMQGKLNKTIVETTQLWYSKANTEAPAKPSSQITSTSTDGNAWRIVVPVYNASYPNYFYCYQWKYTDGTYGWSGVTRDIATGESQERARTAITDASSAVSTAASAQATAESASTNANQAKENASSAVSLANTASTNASSALSTANTASSNASTALSTANSAASDASSAVSTANTAKATADKNVKTSLQLWFTKANETAPNKPTTKVTSTSTDGNAWRVIVPTYSVSYPYYFYCYQYELADGTYTWSDVVYDRATTENQSNSRNAVTGVSTLTTKTNTISDTVDQHSQSISSLNTTVATKADNSTVTTLSNNLSTLEQDVNTFKTTVSSTYSTKNELAEVQDDISDLQAGSKLSDTKSGNIITIDDALVAPSIDITVYGKSTQASYAGKNLFDATQMKDQVAWNVIPVYAPAGTMLIMSTNKPQSGETPCYFRQPSGTQSSTNSVYTGHAITQTVPEAGYVEVVQRLASGEDSFANYQWQIEQGTIATAYEPYVGGKPSPNPDYPQEIKSVDDLTITFAGKNLLPPNLGSTTINGITFTVNTDGSIKVNGTASSIVTHSFAFAMPAGTYTLSGCPSDGSWTNYYTYIERGGSPIVREFGTGATFTIAEAVNLRYAIRISANVTVSNVVFYPQVELGTIVTAYEPYVAPTSASIPLSDHPLRSLPDGTKDKLTLNYIGPSTREGWGVYSKTLVQVVGSVDMGTLMWSPYEPKGTFYTSISDRAYGANSSGMTTIYGNAIKIYSSADIDTYGDYKMFFYSSGTNISVHVKDSRFTVAADYKDAVSGVMVYYALATPVTITLDPIELPILSNPLTAWAEGGSTQPEISVDYWLNNAADIVPHLLDLDAVSKNELKTVETRVSTAESTIDQHSDSIALKANSSDVYTKTETNGLIATEASNRQSAIEQSAEQINLNVSETYSTKTELSDSIKQTDSASGDIIQISGPVDNFVINGKSEQITTTGKNLFDKNTIYNVNGYLNNSGEFVEISVWRVSDYINVSGLNVITISGGTENDTNTRNCWYDADKNFLSAFKATNATNVTVPNNAVYLRISLNSTYINQIQVESGSTATSYEPFTENKASPRPDWPQEIKSINNLYMCIAGGKNLFDKEAASNKNNWLTGAYILFPIHVKPNTKYTISHNGALQRTGIYLCIGYHDYAWVNGSLGLAHSTSAGVCARVRTITSDSTGILYLKVTPSSWDIFISEYIDTIQLELGEEATEYEPYKRVINPTILGTALDDPFDISKNTAMTNGGLPFIYDQTENGYYTPRHQYLRSPITVPGTYIRISFWAKNRVGTQSYSILMNAVGNKFPTGTSAYPEEWTYYEAAWEVPNSGYIDVVVYDQVFIKNVTFSLPSGVNIITLDNTQLRSLSEDTYDILTLSYCGPSDRQGYGIYKKTILQNLGVMVLDGTQATTKSGSRFYFRNDSIKRSSDYSEMLLCDSLVAFARYSDIGGSVVFVEGISAWSSDGYTGQNWVYIALDIARDWTADDIRAYLSENPITFIYPLAIPQVQNLDTIELPIITDELNVWAVSNPITDISATWYTNMGLGTFSKLNTDALGARMTSAESSITQNAENINLKVSKDGVISSINQSAESIKIQASKVEIDGTAIFTNSDFQSQLSNQNYATTTQVATAKSEAINAAATDATNKANAAQQNAIDLIPTDISELNNDAGYQTSSDVNTTITSKGYATTTQAQGYASTAEQNAKTYAEGQAGTVNSSLEAYKSSTNSTLTALQNQVDGQIEAWYKSTDPTLSNEPASTWNTDALKARHEGDIYYNVDNGHSWRWMKSGNTYSWQQIPDSDAAAALAAAQNAQTLANSKRRIFTSTPTPPYDVGDLWVDGTNVKYASTSKTDDQIYSENDWAVTATDDTLAQTALDTAETVQDNLNATRTWYATCETAAATAVKVATITPETTAFELRVGTIVNVEFTATNSAAVANLKLNVNNTGEKSIKYMYNNARNNIPAVGYLVAGIVYQFMYDGDYWTIQNMHYNTNTTYNLGNNNYYKSIKAKTAITAEHIIVGDSSGYSMVTARTTFDLSYPILWCTAAVGLNATNYANLYLTVQERTILNSVPNLTKVLGSTVWLTGTISGDVFTVSSDIATCEVPSTEDGLIYIPIGCISSSGLSTKDFMFISSKELWAYVDGAFRQVDTSTVLATHRIYYRTATANSSLAAPMTWIEEATGNVYNQWTTKVPPLAVNTTAGQTKYLYLYTCEQRKRLDGTALCTKVLLDENTTVIDGGSIITNSVTANQIAAGTITANEISSGAITTDKLDANAVTAAKIDATDLHVSAANIDGTITFGQLSGVQASGDYALSSDIPQDISDLNNDTGFITSADVPTKVSDLENDSGFQNSSQVDAIITGKNYATQTALNTEINQRKAQYGTSSTAAGTAAKAVTCANFELEVGNEITVKFTTANTSAAKVQLNVNSKGAKDIWVGNAVTSASNQLLWGANAYITFKYDGTQFQVIGEPRTWYGACTTAEATAAKAATITGCVVCKGAKVELAMTYANSAASPTLNVSFVGAKNIYFGTGTTQPLISNGTSWLQSNTATFTFDGAVWRTQGKTYIDANSIVTGYISADRIEAGSISGDKITGGTLAIGAFPETTQTDILNSNIHVPSTVAELEDSSDYATKTYAEEYAEEYADGKDSAIAAAAKRTDVSIAVTAINYTNNTATLQATLYIDGTATTSGVTYKWLKDGTVISGQTSRTLSVTSAMGLSHVYSCTVTYS